MMDTVSAEVDVAVVGTGVVGLAGALACAQRGWRVALIGPGPRQFQPDALAPFDPRIYALSPGSVALLESLRVWPQVDAERVQAVTRMRVRGDAGGELSFDAAEVGRARLASIVEETALLRALWLGCRMTPRLEHDARGFVRADFDVATARDAGAGAGARVARSGARLHLSDGGVRHCALLLGADGVDSTVRAAAGFATRSGAYGQTALVANFDCELPHEGAANQWFTDEGVVALLPLPGRRVSLVWSAPGPLADRLAALPGPDFSDRVRARCGFALGALRLLGAVHRFPLRRIATDHVVRPGVALLGDAAHVVHPLAGQGLNLGLQDVSELMRVLAAAEPWRGLGDWALLRRYERVRAEPVRLMRFTVDGLARLFGSGDARVQVLRNLGMAAVDGWAPVKQALIRHALS